VISKDHPYWKRMRFKGNKVWMAVDADQKPVLDKGKALVKYQLDQPHEYWIPPSRIDSLDGDNSSPSHADSSPSPKTAARRRSAAKADETVTPQMCENAVCVYTDGACSGNPGPAGIGIVLRYKDQTKEISRYIGQGTNNIAELQAIKVGLEAVRNRSMPVIVFTDSNYAFGLLSQGWKARMNTALVEEIRKLSTGFKQLRFVKVKGHAGHPENERADKLAVQAIQKRTASFESEKR
jgi:ribonuclease HI